MTDETYNGWTNRETWAIQLHLSNNEGDYNAMREQASEIWDEDEAFLEDEISSEDRKSAAVGTMAEYIKEWTEEVFESVLNSEEIRAGYANTNEAARMFVSDVGSWWRADFYEIAEHWIDEAIESAVKS